MKKLTALLLCLMILASLAVPVSAASGTFLRSYYQVEGNTLQLFGTELPANGTLSVSVGSEKISDASISTVGKSGAPVTFYCLVDTSTNMSNIQVEQQMDVLKTISAKMGTGDNMVIATLSEELTESSILKTAAERNAAIDSIQRKGGYTNIFQAVAQCVQTVSTRADFNTNRCLLILSDGIDDGKTSTTELQVIDTIRGTTVPVFSIAVTDLYPSWYTLDHANHLMRFSEESLGGTGCIPNDGQKVSAGQAAEDIWKTMQNNCVITMDAGKIARVGDVVRVLVRYETASVKYEDAVNVRTVDLNEAAPQPEAQPTETDEPEDEEIEPEKEIPWLLIGGIAAVVVVIILIVVLVIMTNKKKTVPQPPRPMEPMRPFPPMDAPQPMSNIKGVTGPGPDFTMTPATTPLAPVPEENIGVTGAVKPGCRVDLIGIMHPDIHFDFVLPENEPKILGRDDRADIILNSSDVKLSGKHCEMQWDGSHIYLRDVGSTNGTALNGAPMKPYTWNMLEDSSTLRVGGYEYRVKLTKTN